MIINGLDTVIAKPIFILVLGVVMYVHTKSGVQCIV